MTDDSAASQWPPHIAALYQEDTTQLRFMKRQQWAITNYLVLILAAIFGIDIAIGGLPGWQTCAAGVLVWVAAIVAIFLIGKIQFDMKRIRKRLRTIQLKYFSDDERRDLGIGTKKKRLSYDWPFTGALIAVCILGALIVSYTLIALDPK